jgi:hypothetical protein
MAADFAAERAAAGRTIPDDVHLLLPPPLNHPTSS